MGPRQPAPTEAMKFRWPWRPYQQRVLEEIEQHLEDQKLHIVAAPGSGKTILGLEVFRRLGQPTVILSPTIIIRDQWVARLADFLPSSKSDVPQWASTDLSAPAFLTSITYQALHTRYREAQSQIEDERTAEETGDLINAPSEKELRDDIKRFQEAGVGTLILDEAHHLRQAWWKALLRLVNQLSNITLVSLTATPPFDVVGGEWDRYESLCGPIDAEISVPELVRTGTLCPHQDYVYVVKAEKEAAGVKQYDWLVQELLHDLVSNATFAAHVQAHPWVVNASPMPEEVLDRPEFAYSLLVYLKACGVALPTGLLTLLDCRLEDLPGWDRRWCQVLVGEYLYGPKWLLAAEGEDYRQGLGRRLRHQGLLWRRELRIVASRPIQRQLSLAGEKIEACVRICQQEWQHRGASLRQAILTDFIVDDDLDFTSDTGRRLGAWPVMWALGKNLAPEQLERVALLSGRLVVLHENRLEEARTLLRNRHGTFGARPLTTLPDFYRVSFGGGSRLVQPLTQMLSRGQLQVLVGTRALLGEGWDAPCVNSLVLASYVGSFVQTNQLRGRAIRRDPEQPDKAASIWHPVATLPSEISGCSDVDDLSRRFDTFVGLAAEKPVIESGLGRMALPRIEYGLRQRHSATGEIQGRVEEFNREMYQRLQANGHLQERWTDAIEVGTVGRIFPSVQADRPPEVRAFHFHRTVGYVLSCAAVTLASGGRICFERCAGGVGCGVTGAIPYRREWPRIFLDISLFCRCRAHRKAPQTCECSSWIRARSLDFSPSSTCRW